MTATPPAIAAGMTKRRFEERSFGAAGEAGGSWRTCCGMIVSATGTFTGSAGSGAALLAIGAGAGGGVSFGSLVGGRDGGGAM
jgi:hypothetical protein